MAEKKPPDSDPLDSDVPDSDEPSLLTRLPKLSDDELALLTVEAPRELERRKAKREAELLAFIREQATVLGISAARLRASLAAKPGGRKRSDECRDGRSSVKAKYRDPKTGRTWSGRGGAPKWFTDHIDGGGTKDELLVHPNADGPDDAA